MAAYLGNVKVVQFNQFSCRFYGWHQNYKLLVMVNQLYLRLLESIPSWIGVDVSGEDAVNDVDDVDDVVVLRHQLDIYDGEHVTSSPPIHVTSRNPPSPQEEPSSSSWEFCNLSASLFFSILIVFTKSLTYKLVF